MGPCRRNPSPRRSIWQEAGRPRPLSDPTETSLAGKALDRSYEPSTISKSTSVTFSAEPTVTLALSGLVASVVSDSVTFTV